MSSGMWAEKYRPQTLDDIVNQRDIVNRLKTFVIEKNIPHLLLVGPAGVGKTTSILALAQDLYGSKYRNYVLELNASDERGINVIRNKVKNYARTSTMASPISFKIIIMDEADHLTRDAQHALRRTMEVYTKTARFCLIGNYSESIIDPIQSRCSVFRYGSLEEGDIRDRLTLIAKKENLQIVDEGLDALFQASGGDLRKAINMLQAASANGELVDDISVYSLLGSIRPDRVQTMIQLALDGKFLESREALRDILINQGLAPEDIIRITYREVMRHKSLTEQMKVRLSDIIGEVDYRLTQGSRPEIQLSTLLGHLSLVGDETR
jgi:replication factor C small subunit